MKKYLFVLYAFLCSWATAMAQDVEIYSTNEMKAQPGETVTLSLSMKNKIDVKAWSFRLVLPEGIEAAKDTRGRYVYSIGRDDEHSKDARPTSDEPLGVQFSVFGDYPFLESDGEIVTIDLTVSEDAPIGATELRLAKINYSNMEDKSIYQEDLIIPINIYAEYNITAVSANEKMGTVELVGGGEAVESGTSITATATAVDGYKFVYWTNAAGVVISTENPYKFTAEKNIALTANFKTKDYDVNFQVDGVDNIQSLPYGSVITAPENPTKTGYTFTGWNPAFEEGATVPLNGATYVATWSINQYTITFDTDGGSEVEAITLDYNGAVTAPVNPTKTGYTFVKWDTAIPENMPAKNMTIKAIWQINQYTITFQTDGGTEISAIKQDYGTKITAPADPTKEGHTFLGWDKDIPANMPAENMTITATWKINEYTFTFDSNGGSEVASITLPYGSEVTAPENPTREGYTFGGWDAEVPTTMPAEDKAFTAQWTVNKYEVIFKAGENYSKSFEAAYGTSVNGLIPKDVPQTNEEGLPFVGWDPVIDENTTVPAHDVTYVAVYSGQFTITFNTNGGEEMAPIVMEYNAEIGEISNPVRPYYTFLDWTITDEKGKTYDEMPKNMPAANLTLTANWDIDINALKADLMAYSQLEVPGFDNHADVIYTNPNYDYYSVLKAIEEANTALGYNDADDIVAAIEKAETVLDPFIQYCEENGQPVSCVYSMQDEWGTIVLPFDFSIPLGWELYSCDGTMLSENVLALETESRGLRNTPYIVKGNVGACVQYIDHVKNKTVGEVQAGALIGVLNSESYPDEGNYVLQRHGQTLAFYRVNKDVASPVVDPYHCYLTLPNSMAKVIRWEGITDGIEMVDAEAQDGQTIYNLQGQRLQRQTKGINIVNGKKVLNK